MKNNYNIVIRRKYFSSSRLQNYLFFQSYTSHFLTSNGKTYLWKSKGMSEESFTTSSATGKIFNAEIIRLYHGKHELKFKEMCLKQNRIPSLYKLLVTLYITYKVDTWSKDLNTNFTLGNCLLVVGKLIENADPDKYKYNSYNI